MRNFRSTTFILFVFLSAKSFAQPGPPISATDRNSLSIITDSLEGRIEPGAQINQGCNPLLKPDSYQSAQCNPLIEETFNKTQNWSLYSMFRSERPYSECTADIDFEAQSMPEVQRNLAGVTDQGSMFTNMAFQCQEELDDSQDDYSEQTLMLEATHGLTQLRIESMAKRSLQGLNKIDSILGRDIIKDSVICDDKISTDVKNLCETFSSCGRPSSNPDAPVRRRRPRVHFHAQMTIEALKAAKDFDKMITDLTNQKRTLGTAGARGRRHLSTADKERRDEIDFMIEDLRSNKEDVLSTVPWINGLKFKEHLNSIDKELDRIAELPEEDNSVIKNRLESSLTSDIGNHLVEQLVADKEELLRRFDVSKKSAHCLHTGLECGKFEENIAMAPPVDLGLHFDPENPQELFTKRLMEAGQCLEQKRASVSTYNRVAIDVASIGAGFLMGGAGGLVRLASVAGRMYVRGQRIRGLAAGAVLALEGAAVGNGVKDSIHSCQNVRRNMSQFQEADSNFQCNSDSDQMTLMTNYKQCLTDVLLTSVGVIAGVAPDIARSIRSSRAAGLGDVAEESADELLKGFRGSAEEAGHLRQAMINMNISADEVADFRKVLSSAENVFESTKNSESFLVYFNHLSRKKQKEILDNLPDILKSTPSSPALPRKAESIRLSWNKELRRIQRTERAAIKRARERHVASGKGNSEANRLARQEARAARAKGQETRLGCRASKMTAQHKAGAASFTRFSVAFALGSTGASFTAANTDRPKDAEFFKDLSYELVTSYVMSKIGARIMANPTTGITRRYIQSNVRSSLVGGIDALVFAQMYGISESEALERIERIKNSPAQMEALAKLEKYMEEEDVIQKIENSNMAQLRHALEAPETRELFLEEGVPIGDGSVTGPLHVSDLDDPEKAERIKRAIMTQFYEEQKGSSGRGSVLADKFVYDRYYNALVGAPKAMAAGYLTYAALCRNADNPVMGLTQAFGIQALNQGLGGYYYFDWRKDYVGR